MKALACAGIAQHFGAKGNVRLRGSAAANGACGDRGITTELHFAAQNGVSAASIHDEEHEVRGFSADLKTNAAALKRHHGRRAPRTVEMLTGAARHHAASVAATDNKGGFQNGWENDDAFCFVDETLRNVVGNIHNFFDDVTSVFNAAGFFFVISCGLGGDRQSNHSERDTERNKVFHSGEYLLFLNLSPDSIEKRAGANSTFRPVLPTGKRALRLR